MIKCLHYVRGTAAIAVLVSHAGGNLTKSGRAPDGLEAWLAPAAPFGVYLFFALSGFVIAAAHAGDIDQPSKLGPYAFKRFTRIFPIYWIVALATIGLGLLSASLRHPAWGEPAWLIGAITLLPFHGVDGPQGVPAWTLFHEVIFYGLFASLILSRRFGVVVFSLWLAACVTVAATGSKYLYPLLAKENLIFAMGALAFLIYHRGWAAGLAPWAVAISLSALAVAWVMEVLVITDPNLSDATKYLTFGAPAALALCALATLEHRAGDRIRSWLLGLLGDASYSIYLVHFLAISAMGKARAGIDWSLGIFWPVEFAAVVLIATTFGVAVHLAVEKPLLGRVRRLGGVSQRLRPSSQRSAAPAAAGQQPARVVGDSRSRTPAV